MSSSCRRSLALSLILVLASGSAFAQTPEQKATARSLAQQGADAFDRGAWEESVDRFERAERFVHAPPHLLFIARANAKLGRLIQAREAYLSLQREVLPESAPPVFVEAKQAADAELPVLEARVPALTVTVQGPGSEKARVKVGGGELDPALLGVSYPVNPGTYELVAEGDGSKSLPVTLVIVEGERKEVTLDLLPVASPTPVEVEASSEAPSMVPAYVALGVGGVGVAVGGVFGILSLTNASSADSQFADCDSNPGSCGSRERAAIEGLDSDAATMGTISLVGLGVGVVGLGAGLALLFTADSAPSAAARHGDFTLRPFVTMHRLGVVGTF